MVESSSLQRSALAAIPKASAPLRRQVLEQLRQSIISGRLVPGERLVERELIAMMGVSRTVIREALRQLESEGLVAIIPNKGPVVRIFTLDEARELYAIRSVLEGLAARLFVEQSSDAQISRLEAALTTVESAYDSGDAAKMLEAKNNFYHVLLEGARSSTLSNMLDLLHGQIWRWRAMGLAHPQRSEMRGRESTTNLRTLLEAMKNRNATLAEDILRDEIDEAAKEVNRLLQESRTAANKMPAAS